MTLTPNATSNYQWEIDLLPMTAAASMSETAQPLQAVSFLRQWSSAKVKRKSQQIKQADALGIQTLQE